mmetsp:Transcript_18348/g.57350  ORF Transcript_18348/g.57350 Transcript_18348/m.57350 type:complete len:129 (+) Transcript_18348:3-389(+)
MVEMFKFARAFNQPLNAWDVSSVTTMSYMFYCYDATCAFNQPLNDWDVSSVTTMRAMFYCYDATCAFNQPLNDWDVSRVTTMEGMFYDANAFNQDLGWCLSPNAVTINTFFGSGCESNSCGVNSESCA